MKNEYDYFTTSDGHLYAVPVKPDIPGWTPRQKRLARRIYVFAFIFLCSLVGLLGTFIGYKLLGG